MNILKIFGIILMIFAALFIILCYEDTITSKLITRYLLSVFIFLYGFGCTFFNSKCDGKF
jgi:hypothetical protein